MNRPELTPFRNKEGFLEVWFFDWTWSVSVHFLLGEGDLSKWACRIYRLKQGVTTSAAESASAFEVLSSTEALVAAVVCLPSGWNRTDRDIVLLTHETHHVTSYVMERRGVAFGRKQDEPHAYFQDSLVNRFLYAMDRKEAREYKNRKEST